LTCGTLKLEDNFNFNELHIQILNLTFTNDVNINLT